MRGLMILKNVMSCEMKVQIKQLPVNLCLKLKTIVPEVYIHLVKDVYCIK